MALGAAADVGPVVAGGWATDTSIVVLLLVVIVVVVVVIYDVV